MSTLVFDIETVGENFDGLDKTSQEALTSWIRKTSNSEEEYNAKLEDLKNELGFSPLTGEIVAIAILDYEKDKAVVYFQSPNAEIKEFEEDSTKYKSVTEKEMLENFWKGVASYDSFVTFNGRGFDVPFLMIRSAIHKIRPSKNLMSNRYFGSQTYDSKHIDLMDQLSFYGASRTKGGLHMYCRAFGIKTPKDGGIKGEEVAKFFKEGKYLDIARYNGRDIRATGELYAYWLKYLKF